MKENVSGKTLPIIFLTILLDSLGYGILIPVIPLLLANPHSSFYLLPKSLSLNDGYVLLGFLTAAYPLGQFFATPILGQLSDKYGRKKILAISLAGTCVSYIIFALGILMRNVPLLFISRAFDGITGGNVSVAQAAIADITTPQNRAKNFGLLGAAFGIGFILGPYIGGKLSDPSIVSWFNATVPFWFAAIMSALNVATMLFIFPETNQHQNPDLKLHFGKSIKNIMHAYTLKELRILFVTFFLFNAGFTFFTTFFSIFLIDRFGFTQGNIGDFFSYVGIWMAFTQAVLTRKFSSWFKEYQILRITMMGLGLLVLCYFLPNQWWQLLFITPFFAACVGLTFANSAGLVSRSVDHSIQGEVLGINSSVQALAQSIPPILSGYIAASLTPETPILVASLVVTLGGFIFTWFFTPKVEKIHQAEVEPAFAG